MQLSILTCNLPWSLVKDASLYVMGNHGKNVHVYCIKQALWGELKGKGKGINLI